MLAKTGRWASRYLTARCDAGGQRVQTIGTHLRVYLVAIKNIILSRDEA